MDVIAPGVDREIYPMPAFVSLEVADVARTVDWYVNGLDFVSLFTMPAPDGGPALVHLRRWRYQDILVRPGTPEPGGGVVLSVMAVAEQMDALVARATAHGSGRVEGPYDTPWNSRDVRTVDPDGYQLVYTSRRPAGERDAAFEAGMARMAREQLGTP